jgi:hypothetical protein
MTEPIRVKKPLSVFLSGRYMAIPANIRLGWKGLPGTNAPAFYEKSKFTTVKVS